MVDLGGILGSLSKQTIGRIPVVGGAFSDATTAVGSLALSPISMTMNMQEQMQNSLFSMFGGGGGAGGAGVGRQQSMTSSSDSSSILLIGGAGLIGILLLKKFL